MAWKGRYERVRGKVSGCDVPQRAETQLLFDPLVSRSVIHHASWGQGPPQSLPGAGLGPRAQRKQKVVLPPKKLPLIEKRQ